MKHISIKDIQRIDHAAIRIFGIPSVVLMENAGRAVAEEASRILKRTGGRRACVVCGTGNNGGDGLVAARHLAGMNFEVDVIVAGTAGNLKSDPLVNLRILNKLKIPVKFSNRLTPDVQQKIHRADVIVDAIFGVGLDRIVESPVKELIEAINAANSRTVSADVPSGLNADTGEILGSCVKADTTVTFTFPKKGFIRSQAKKYLGRVRVVEIGIPNAAVKRIS